MPIGGEAWRGITLSGDSAFPPGGTHGERAAGPERHAVLHGTPIATDRRHTPPAGYVGANQDPYHSGKHHRHGVNVQGMTGPDGEPLFLGEAHRGSTHDTAAARDDRIVEAATNADAELIADLGYHGVGGTVRTPVKRKPGRGPSPRDQRANREHAQVRCQGEHGFAQLKAFKVLRRVRISPSRITTLARSIHTLIRLRTSLAGVQIGNAHTRLDRHHPHALSASTDPSHLNSVIRARSRTRCAPGPCYGPRSRCSWSRHTGSDQSEPPSM
jgi:hypothetical protein